MPIEQILNVVAQQLGWDETAKLNAVLEYINGGQDTYPSFEEFLRREYLE